MWSPVSVCKGIDWRQEEKWGEKSTKVTKVTKERGGKKEARSENKVVKIKSKLMRVVLLSSAFESTASAVEENK